MRLCRWFIVYPLAVAVVLAVIGLGGGWWLLRQSLPELAGTLSVAALSAPVTITSDRYAIPVIQAENRLDAVRALGFITARDRLFQMDLLRRKSAGRLSELFGAMTVGADTAARIYGYPHIAQAALAKLPPEHQRYLAAYTEGVNSFIGQAKALPFEFTLLNYRPEPWQASDSLLVALGMSEMLTAWAETEERMLSVMTQTLPAEVVAFLTPDTDRFTDSLYPKPSWRPAQAVPTAALEKLLLPAAPPAQADATLVREFVRGSNAWAVSGTKTADGRAILANDMHLDLSVPNIWYRAELKYGNTHSVGVVLPGTPVFVAGSNGHIAWGNTNLTGDFLDLVSLEINPANPGQYKVGDHWQDFSHKQERIIIKDAPAKDLDVQMTVWGPVTVKPLLGKPVAIHWTALEADNLGLGLLDLEPTATLPDALAVVNAIGGPQLNVLLADDQGHIAWTLMGKIPRRIGMDGSVSRSWADGKVGWDGYVNPQELPRVTDPAQGFLVSANDRRLGKDYPYIIGHQFAPGNRAYRISERLGQMQETNEWALFNLQGDTEMALYGFYQQLALGLLSPATVRQHPELQELRDYLMAWDGRADTDSLGFALLQQFRKQLVKTVLTPFLSACKSADNNFSYSWLYVDTPLQALLKQKSPALLPDPTHYKNWDDFIIGQLQDSAQRLKTQAKTSQLAGLTWGKINKTRLLHPIFGAVPIIGDWLNMPEQPLAGCGGCVRANGPGFGASERLVVSPSHLDDGILQMPGGQSAHPLSANYRDQQAFWVQGLPLPLLAGTVQHTLVLSNRPQ
ncbi:penicillin acylase family protein [Methylovulum psychrotolerans]|uniref:penicillin acylase family protein n=1 Tax=Methylovulum psychrotolerans TaxID=1704499 RepID=UPI001BFF77B2|nr:penicillin acylase family protein [Methylovulum psychrotolerans]MBT9100302.1 penicillin acylase family protein [Methylovulum psychrotolerans]